MIRFRCTDTPIQKADADLVAIAVWRTEGRTLVPGSSDLHKTLDRLCRADGFGARQGETFLYHAPPRSAAARYLVVGLGPQEKGTLDAVRVAGSAAARRATALGARSLAIELSSGKSLPGADDGGPGQALVEGALLGTYRFDRYLGDAAGRKSKLRSVDVLAVKGAVRAVRSGVRTGELFGEATNFARSLVDEPASALTPMRMAALARTESRRVGLQCRVLRLPELRKRKMGGILGVSQGSAEEPCLIHLRYRPKGKPKRRIALVGKGITFDSGGLSLKSPTGMVIMKSDMAGSAVVFAVLRALPALGLPIQVDGVMAMSENMPSGTAQRPGDVLRTMSGKTVEVVNTDAEGRLVLADALTFAAEFAPNQMIDLATLTGACVVALGPLASGVMGTDQALIDSILEAGRVSGEKVWHLPLYDEYLKMLKSPIADMKNAGERWGGALTAGLFLREFVKPGIPWAHMDIAGPAFLEKDHLYLRKGASGAGVRTLLHYLEQQA